YILKRSFLALCLFALMMAAAGCSDLTKTDQTAEPAVALLPTASPSSEPTEAPTPTPTPTPTPAPIITKATLGAIGDVLIHSSIYKDAYQADGTYNFMPMFSNVKPFMQKPDILIANQESMIGGTQLGLSSYPRFNSPHEVGDAIKDAGVD